MKIDFNEFALKYKVLFIPSILKLQNSYFMNIQNKRLFGILLTVVIILLVPFIAMQFTEEVKWSPFDFIVAGILLLGTGLLCELVLRKVSKTELRITICVAIILALLLIWAELAVGIFGTPFGGH